MRRPRGPGYGSLLLLLLVCAGYPSKGTSLSVYRALVKHRDAANVLNACRDGARNHPPSCRGVAEPGKAVVVVGDSTSEHHYRNWLYHALSCKWSEGESIRLSVSGSNPFVETSRSVCVSFIRAATLCYVSAGRLYGRGLEDVVNEAVGLPKSVKESTLFVVNAGIHFNDLDVLHDRVTRFAEVAKKSELHLVFRETFPQFFKKGMYTGPERCRKNQKCKAIKRSLLKKGSQFNVKVEPTLVEFNVTIAHAWKAFVDDRAERVTPGCEGTKMDCSHFCPFSKPYTKLTERLVAEKLGLINSVEDTVVHYALDNLLGANRTAFNLTTLADFANEYRQADWPKIRVRQSQHHPPTRIFASAQGA